MQHEEADLEKTKLRFLEKSLQTFSEAYSSLRPVPGEFFKNHRTGILKHS